MTQSFKFPTEKHLAEIKGDLFGYEDLSQKVLDNILLQMELPNCFGVYGNWGSGKTTFTYFLEQHINEKSDSDIVVVRFEPWKYEYANDKDLIFALLREIEKALFTPGDKKAFKKALAILLTAGTEVLEQVPKAAAASLGLPIAPEISVSNAAKNLEMWQNLILTEYERWVDNVLNFKNSFEDFINKSLNKNHKKKLFIIIDDLDRCLPENAVKLLESIKNFLSVENTLFIFALDSGVVAEMIEKKYGLQDGYGQEYLMKIIHYYFNLPIADRSQLIKEIMLSHGGLPQGSTEAHFKYIKQFTNQFLLEPRRLKHFLHRFYIDYNLLNEEDRGFLMEQRRSENGLELTSRFCDYFLLSYIKHVQPSHFNQEVIHILTSQVQKGDMSNQNKGDSRVKKVLKAGFSFINSGQFFATVQPGQLNDLWSRIFKL